MAIDLPFIWAALIAFTVLTYVVLDGFDLGVGILFALFPERSDRDVMTNSVAPVWDGNETWLVLGGGGLMAVFPLAYAIIFPALYIPIIVMLLALVFRGVAFEFRWRAGRWIWLWDWGFGAGSIVAAFTQGIALGALVQGIHVEGRAYAGGWWDWLTPFSLLVGIAVVIGYGLLGATWLNLKTEGALQERSRHIAMISGAITVALIGVVSIWTATLSPVYFERWFGFPTAFFSAIVPLLVAVCAVGLWHGLRSGWHLIPFLAALGMFVLSFAGIGISFYPFIIPGALTFHDAAAPDSSLQFLLVGAAVLVPIILIYTAHAYWVFRGKISPQDGYH